jgi:hypothetical protein
MSALDDYRAIIAPHCGPAFAFREICKPPNVRFQVPPFAMARRMIPTLELANELRLRMSYRCDREGWGFHGLRVNAAFRPRGGAPNSQHKHNRALDLDLMFRDWDPATVDRSTEIRRAWYEVAVGLWLELGREERIGLGLYCSRGRDYGVRVHIDTGYGYRTWQIAGVSTGIHPPCTHAIADRLGSM